MATDGHRQEAGLEQLRRHFIRVLARNNSVLQATVTTPPVHVEALDHAIQVFDRIAGSAEPLGIDALRVRARECEAFLIGDQAAFGCMTPETVTAIRGFQEMVNTLAADPDPRLA